MALRRDGSLNGADNEKSTQKSRPRRKIDRQTDRDRETERDRQTERQRDTKKNKLMHKAMQKLIWKTALLLTETVYAFRT